MLHRVNTVFCGFNRQILQSKALEYEMSHGEKYGALKSANKPLLSSFSQAPALPDLGHPRSEVDACAAVIMLPTILMSYSEIMSTMLFGFYESLFRRMLVRRTLSVGSKLGKFVLKNNEYLFVLLMLDVVTNTARKQRIIGGRLTVSFSVIW